MSLMTLSLAFSALTLVLVVALVLFLRRRATDARRATRKDVLPQTLKAEE